MTSKWITVCALGLLAQLFAQGQASFGNERRVALVIGNSAYSAKGRPLKNPASDARSMSQVLTGLNFDVITKLDARQAEMDAAIREFTRRLGPGTVGVFFYAGHGVQIDGLNYILPVDYDERGLDEVNLKRSSVRVDEDLVRPMEKSGARLTLVILWTPAATIPTRPEGAVPPPGAWPRWTRRAVPPLFSALPPVNKPKIIRPNRTEFSPRVAGRTNWTFDAG